MVVAETAVDFVLLKAEDVLSDEGKKEVGGRKEEVESQRERGRGREADRQTEVHFTCSIALGPFVH